MTNLTVNLNKLASELCGEATKVRARLRDGVLQIRPTYRKIAKGLPKGEVLFDLKTRADRGTKRFTMPGTLNFDGILPVGSKALMSATKHGWIAIAVVDSIPSEIGKAAPAGCSVTDK